ncbi:MAG TPA: type II CAAX endopeptidase family protein [Thermoanaerobaculia bacterium]|nr:type II CAAX endopeptidase family protein [Thermoanaerobaculia bacterium]
MTTLTRRDWTFLAVCAAVTVASLLVIARYFAAAFQEASIDFRYDRGQSRQVALDLLRAQGLDPAGMKHAVVFESDDIARIFLERTLGLERANEAMSAEVLVWYWRHRWFRPLQEEEYAAEIAPTGELVSFSRTIPESQPMPETDDGTARAAAEEFLRRAGVELQSIELVSESERKLPARVQRILTFESKSIRPGGAPYRYVLTVDGGSVSSFARRLRVPEEWIRSYRELRSKNESAGRVTLIFMMITMIAALAVFIARLRRGELRIRFLLIIGAVTAVLVAGVTANSFPAVLSGYDTTTSYPAFIAQLVLVVLIQSIGSAMLLIVICGAGEVLYRQRLPQHLAIPRLWTRRALASRSVFLSLVLGYTLVGFFIAYQVTFYIVAAELGAWAPADIPYDNMLSTAIPWVAVLFAGFFPAFSEEFLSRAFSIPFFERVFRSRLFAIVLAGFIWGFGHATYPQQPFYIRGIEVGLAGVLLGFLMYRYGLLALLIWHYTVDAVYTSLLLFRSGNAYYVTSATMATLVFAFPLIASIVLYVRNRGFVPDDDLTNAALPAPSPPPPPPPQPEDVPLPPAVAPSRLRVAGAVLAVAAAAALIAFRPATPQDVVDYRIDGETAKSSAAEHLRALGQPVPSRVAAIPVSGFRSWNPDSPREEGGAPGGFDEVAATYMVRNGMPVRRLNEIMRREIHAATWMVRLFDPGVKTEYFVEVDPRNGRVVGYHKYADERAPGERLEREAALEIASRAFGRYGSDPSLFTVRESLSFQQPERRDWLFHFEGRTPLVAEAVHRVSVRVMGSEVTELVNTVRVPEAVYREAEQQTIETIALLVLKIGGIIAGLALVIAGAILATRRGGTAWRKAGRLTAILAVIPIAGAAIRGDRTLFAYNTSVAWETFRLNVITDVVRTAGVQVLLLFLALAGTMALVPHASRLLGREGRARLGRAAALGAVTAVAIAAAVAELVWRIGLSFPSRMRIDELSIPPSIALPLPALFEMGQAVFGAILLSAAVALYATAVRPWRRQWLAAAVTIGIVFCLMLDVNAGPRELPLMLALTAALTTVVWLVARRILDGHLLAWPAAILTASLVQSGAALLQNHRPDLLLQGGILLAVAALMVIWLVSSRGMTGVTPRPTGAALPPSDSGPAPP